MGNKVYLAVDEDGSEVIFPSEPERDYHPEGGHFWQETISFPNSYGRIVLPKGTIKKLTNKTLTWEDNPIEFFS